MKYVVSKGRKIDGIWYWNNQSFDLDLLIDYLKKMDNQDKISVTAVDDNKQLDLDS